MEGQNHLSASENASTSKPLEEARQLSWMEPSPRFLDTFVPHDRLDCGEASDSLYEELIGDVLESGPLNFEAAISDSVMHAEASGANEWDFVSLRKNCTTPPAKASGESVASISSSPSLHRKSEKRTRNLAGRSNARIQETERIEIVASSPGVPRIQLPNQQKRKRQETLEMNPKRMPQLLPNNMRLRAENDMVSNDSRVPQALAGPLKRRRIERAESYPSRPLELVPNIPPYVARRSAPSIFPLEGQYLPHNQAPSNQSHYINNVSSMRRPQLNATQNGQVQFDATNSMHGAAYSMPSDFPLYSGHEFAGPPLSAPRELDAASLYSDHIYPPPSGGYYRPLIAPVQYIPPTYLYPDAAFGSQAPVWSENPRVVGDSHYINAMGYGHGNMETPYFPYYFDPAWGSYPHG